LEKIKVPRVLLAGNFRFLRIEKALRILIISSVPDPDWIRIQAGKNGPEK
jgi:hypothetical protein